MKTIEFGLDTFGDITSLPSGGSSSASQVIRDVIDEAVLADELGIDFIGLGEHHRADFAISAPEMVLAAIAGRTRGIRLGSAVTVLSSDDPVRVFQRFSTLDAISRGRAEIIVGRGSFIESFPLFGFPLGQYETLFEEKLDLLVQLLRHDEVSWSGTVRAPLERQRVFPTVEERDGHREITTWVGVGGTPESVVRAARHRLPMLLAIIGGEPARFVPYVELYHRACRQYGHEPGRIGVHSPGYIAATDAQARDEFWADYKTMRDRIGAERGWPPMQRAEFDSEIARGSLYVGSAETVARKIAATIKVLGASRFQLKYSAGPLPHARLMSCIEQYGRVVVPMVRDMLA